MTTPGATPSAGKRRWRKATVIAALLLLAFAGGMLLYLNSAAFEQSVRRKVVAELERMTGGKVELQSLTWKLSSLQFEARGLTIHGLEGPGEAPYAQAGHISVGVKIVSFFSRKIALRNVAMDHVGVHLIVYPDGSTNQPVPKEAPAGEGISPQSLVDIAVNRIEISDGALILNQEQVPFSITAERLSAVINHAPQEKGYAANISMSLLAARWRNLPPQRGDINVDLLLRSNGADIRSLRVATGRSSVQASGTVRNYNNPELRLQYNASVDLAEAAALASVPSLRGGRVEAKGSLTYEKRNYSSRGSLSVKGGEWRDGLVRVAGIDASSAFSVSPDAVSFSHIAARIFGGTALGDLQVTSWAAPTGGRKAPPQKGKAAFRVSRLSISEMAAAVSTKEFPLEKINAAGAASGDIKAGWTGSIAN
ncbi:MAG TPA: hypothetical protein VLT16_01300, partial [Candidatus Limnocylindrales bacterium]|nr:hypothetical protein [Candidatus Limnocylindrales bacterium]